SASSTETSASSRPRRPPASRSWTCRPASRRNYSPQEVSVLNMPKLPTAEEFAQMRKATDERIGRLEALCAQIAACVPPDTQRTMGFSMGEREQCLEVRIIPPNGKVFVGWSGDEVVSTLSSASPAIKAHV